VLVLVEQHCFILTYHTNFIAIQLEDKNRMDEGEMMDENEVVMEMMNRCSHTLSSQG